MHLTVSLRRNLLGKLTECPFSASLYVQTEKYHLMRSELTGHNICCKLVPPFRAASSNLGCVRQDEWNGMIVCWCKLHQF